MPAIDDLTAIRRLLDVPHPTDSVTAAGQGRLDELTRHDGSLRRPGRATHGAMTVRGRRIGIFATAISVAATAVTLALVYPGSAPSTATRHVDTPKAGAAPTAPGSATPGSVKQAILTAIRSAGGDIMHLTVSTTGGPSVGRGVVEYWWWPAKPAPGQQVHLLFFGTTTRVEVTFTEPASFPTNGSLQPIPASGFFLVPAAKTWQKISQFAPDGVFSQTSGYLMDESYMRSTYLTRSTVVNDHATIDGRGAIEIGPPAIPSLRVLLWVDAQTYLPLRMTKLDSGATNSPITRKIYEYQFLPATPANVATLTLTVPIGYTKAPS